MSERTPPDQTSFGNGFDPASQSLGAPVRAGADRAEQLLDGLNPAQREAVTYGEGPLLVLAGAGSGKTRVLTHRIAHLLATERARPSEILAITFTNKAAGEMRERVGGLVGRVSRLMWVMTFHSACARILRTHAERLGYRRQFTIYDEADSRRMVKRCMDENEVDPKRFPVRSVKAQISGAKNRLLDARSFAERQGSYFEQTVAEVYSLYERRMVEASAMDFDDLLVRAVDLMELAPDVLDSYRRAFRWVLVDEYQDTNRAQYKLLSLLAGEHRNLTVVGDEAQSIYGFRHADIRNILDFTSEFTDAHTVKLEQNYRSTQVILEAANAIISNNREQIPKRLWTDRAGGDDVRIAELEDEHAEARYVVGEIERLHDEGVSRSEIAVFYRTNAQSRVLEDTLVRYDLPYQVIGGTRFYDRAEIKDAVAYLQLIANPADAVSFARVVNSPRRGIGDKTVGRIVSHANTIGEPVSDVVASAEAIPGLGTAAIRSVARFAETLTSLRERAAGADSVADLIGAVLRESGYLEALEAERTIEAEGRIENLEELISLAGEFDANRRVERDGGDEEGADAGLSALDEFLQQISLYSEQDALTDDESKLTLMTVHNAKGLEYGTVFVIGCEEGVFPHMRSLEEGNVEEERRLAYVAVTRAQQRLYLTCARRRNLHGGWEDRLASRFLGEIPDEIVERYVTPALQTGWSLGRGSESAREVATGFSPLSSAARSGGAPAARPRPQAPSVSFAVGDDVVHASFGDGVITGVEPGSVVVVRFASDGAERKLMAEYAPLKRVGRS